MSLVYFCVSCKDESYNFEGSHIQLTVNSMRPLEQIYILKLLTSSLYRPFTFHNIENCAEHVFSIKAQVRTFAVRTNPNWYHPIEFEIIAISWPGRMVSYLIFRQIFKVAVSLLRINYLFFSRIHYLFKVSAIFPVDFQDYCRWVWRQHSPIFLLLMRKHYSWYFVKNYK